MKSWIHLKSGRVLRQAHVDLPSLGGLKEDELGRSGFSGRVAELYRRNEPTAWTRLVGNLRPWDIDGYGVKCPDESNADAEPLMLFHNEDVAVFISRRRATMPHYFRNATGDEVHFVHEGTGEFDTEFGSIPYEPGDWIVLPKGTTYRVVPETDRNYFFIVETIGEVEFPDFGPIGRHAPFDPELLYVPSLGERASPEPSSDGEWEVRIKHGDEFTSLFYPFDPLDVEGWKGDLFPFKFNIRDYRGIMSNRIHIMPSAYCIFKASGVLFCNFLPRPAESDYDAERIPPFHRNIDYDELLFAHGGGAVAASFEPASIFLSPQGIHHGLPDEMAQEMRRNWQKHLELETKLIAIETTRPLKITPAARIGQRQGNQISDAKF